MKNTISCLAGRNNIIRKIVVTKIVTYLHSTKVHVNESKVFQVIDIGRIFDGLLIKLMKIFLNAKITQICGHFHNSSFDAF